MKLIVLVFQLYCDRHIIIIIIIINIIIIITTTTTFILIQEKGFTESLLN